MKKLILLLLTLNSMTSIGQSLFSVKGGLNLTNISASDNFFNNDYYRIGFSGGIGYERFIKNNYFIGGDIIFSQRGFSGDIFLRGDQGNTTGKIPPATFFYDYMSIPIKGGINFGQKLSGFGNIGIIPSFLVNAVTTIPTFDMNGQVDGKESYNVTSRVTKVDFAGLIEVGMNYKLTEEHWIFSSLSYQNSLTTITNNDYFNEFKIKHYGFTLSIGLKYKLSNA